MHPDLGTPVPKAGRGHPASQLRWMEHKAGRHPLVAGTGFEAGECRPGLQVRAPAAMRKSAVPPPPGNRIAQSISPDLVAGTMRLLESRDDQTLYDFQHVGRVPDQMWTRGVPVEGRCARPAGACGADAVRVRQWPPRCPTSMSTGATVGSLIPTRAQ